MISPPPAKYSQLPDKTSSGSSQGSADTFHKPQGESRGKRREKLESPCEIVVVGDDMWNTYGIIRSLGEAGERPSFINICTNRSWVRHSRYISRYFQVSTPAEAVESLKENFPDGAVVLCSSDPSMQAIDSSTLPKRFITFGTGNPGETTRMMSKDWMLALARQVGFDVPRTVSLDLNTANIDSQLKNVVYPCITKAENSLIGSKSSLHICHDLKQLTEALAEIKSGGCTSVQVQQYIEKEYEMLLTGCSDGKGNVVIPGMIKKITEYPMGFTALADIDPHIEQYIDPQKIRDFMTASRFCGIFSMEWLLSKGKMWFMEANFRNDGNSYAPTPGGLNIHKIWVAAMRGKDMARNPERIDRKYTFQVENNSLNYHHYRAKGYRSFLPEFLKADFRLVCNLRDPGPALHRFILSKIKIPFPCLR